MRYVDGGYNDPATFKALQTELGSARHPVRYLAIPPKLFATVVRRLGESGVRAAGGWSWRSPSATISRAPKS